ncbi:hypothetical protein PV10_09075 [Exophiala mesophila]|uniref:Luciferase domain-containing protein n=1 Tax=Exophiala mesophila TaxID=212818 RepID=A0A0D1XIZ2_EXOME|nr:uncharacterized protein PV10_09075 [Exophiala mesophila]KIV88151.1 hypothetical protein PV10_09075 [Exophiala mesophila]
MAVHTINADVHYASLTGLSISLGLSAVALVLGLSSLLFLGLIWCVQDYRAFKALGPGGPPYNIRGWMTVAFLVKPFTLSARDTTWTGDYPTSGAHKSLLALPLRKGGRPDVRGIAPQRQFSQRPLPEMNQRIIGLLTASVMNNPNFLQQRVSSLEKHHSALFVHPSLLHQKRNLPQTATATKGEIGHIHGDSSLHLYLSPADARVVIEKGWAQRHRLARTQPWWYPGRKRFVCGIGDTFLMIYAPRDDMELRVLDILIRASARFMTGQEDII